MSYINEHMEEGVVGKSTTEYIRIIEFFAPLWMQQQHESWAVFDLGVNVYIYTNIYAIYTSIKSIHYY